MALAIPLPTAAAGVGDLSGSWTYTATCPGPETVSGDVYFECARSGVCEGVLTNDLGLRADVTVQLDGETVFTEMDWGEGVTGAVGILAPDGRSWIVEDTEGCRAEVVRRSI